jgi:hypothetical protein
LHRAPGLCPIVQPTSLGQTTISHANISVLTWWALHTCALVPPSHPTARIRAVLVFRPSQSLAMSSDFSQYTTLILRVSLYYDQFNRRLDDGDPTASARDARLD